MSASEALLLGIDTTTSLGGLALAGAGGLRAEYAADVHGSHAARIMPGIERMLNEAELAPGDLSGIGVSIGPGSFTGLRVGVATAMGLARAAGLPLYPVPTLEAVAWTVVASSGGAVAVAMVARKGEIYGAVYRPDGEWVAPVMAPAALTPAEFMQRITRLNMPLAVCGTAADDLAGETCGSLHRVARLFDYPRAAAVAWRAVALHRDGSLVAPDEIRPHYLKASQAEREWARRQTAGG
ncbi:MAG: tRNA (adenosine(37)-N6)-threonylcarbamoyltransferase complex dimerization subunit type 1 TsaB [Nitrospirota bacterium]|nr:tRNA (adenosine(37)-N6)-threonylcarbamoyltransferase complex dimerization subunit type 1 TsaB [Nitrospirota bacterium]